MKKSETEDSNDDVFYSLSSAVSVTASDITRTPSPSPTTSQTVAGNVSSSAESKPSKLSRLKAFRPRKLIPKRFKTPPEVSLLPSDSDTPEKLSGKKESKIPKRTKASQLVRRLTFKKGQKVAPKGVDADEDTSTTSSSTTPMSMKRETPEGAILSISEQSLCVVEERSVEESSADQSERKSSSASNQSSTKQELKITISGKKIEKLKRFYETSDDTKDTRSFEQLKYDVSAIARDTNTASLSSSDKTSLSAVTKTKKNKKSTIAPVLLPSPPPSPLMSIHIPLKLDTPKPISTISTKRDQVPSITAVAAATTRLASNENKNIVTDRDEQSSRQQQSLSEATKKSDTKKESLKSKLINKLNISRSVHDITPAVVAPVVPYEISDQEISSIVTSHALTPEEYTEFIKQDRDKSLSEQTTEKIFTLSEPNEASMKRSENTGSSETQIKHSTKIGKKRSKKTTHESSDSGLSTSVHVQEPQQPYQKQLSTSKSHDLNDPELTLNATVTGTGTEDEVTINKTGEISFRIGTPVRPPTTSSTNITHITESISLDSTENTKSLEEISSISSESQSPPTSESSRKKIKYLPQPTIYSSEEQALLEGNFGPPSSFVGSEYSIDYSLNPLSMVETAPEGAASGTQQVGVVRFAYFYQ